MTRYSHRDRRRVIKLAFLASAAAALALTVQGADAASLNSVTGALAAQSRLVLLTHGCHSHCRWWPMRGNHRHLSDCSLTWSRCTRVDGRLLQRWWRRY